MYLAEPEERNQGLAFESMSTIQDYLFQPGVTFQSGDVPASEAMFQPESRLAQAGDSAPSYDDCNGMGTCKCRGSSSLSDHNWLVYLRLRKKMEGGHSILTSGLLT
jgi:hypothetical protein